MWSKNECHKGMKAAWLITTATMTQLSIILINKKKGKKPEIYVSKK